MKMLMIIVNESRIFVQAHPFACPHASVCMCVRMKVPVPVPLTHACGRLRVHLSCAVRCDAVRKIAGVDLTVESLLADIAVDHSDDES